MQRYSAQRTFSEVYRLTPGFEGWRCVGEQRTPVAWATQPAPRLLPRRVPYPRFDVVHPRHDVAGGSVMRDVQPDAPLWRDRSLLRIGTDYQGYAEHECETLPSLEIQTMRVGVRHEVDEPHDPLRVLNLDADSFHPNWPMWLVLQLEEYRQRSGDRAMVDAFAQRIAALLRFFEPYENEHGLIENAPRQTFIEWSKANTFLDGLNFPLNMTWAGALAAAARLYHRDDWARKADAVRAAIRERSFDGAFFVDQAVRENGKLIATRNRTEVCQYLAFFMGVADPASHPRLWHTLRDDFGPHRPPDMHPQVHPANAFIGNVLRLELLAQHGHAAQARAEMKGYFAFMAERTGTLWENSTPHASCCHGFASHVCYMLLRDPRQG